MKFTWPTADDQTIMGISFGDSSVGNLPAPIRHIAWWAISLALVAVSAFDTTPIRTDPHEWQGIALVALWLGIAPAFLVIEIVRGIEHYPVWQSLSRIALLLVFLVGYLSLILNGARVDAIACPEIGCPELSLVEPAGDRPIERASPSDLAASLVWHTFDVVPGLDATDATGWANPVRSSDRLVRTAAIVIRVFTLVLLVGMLKRLWDSISNETDAPPTFGDYRRTRAIAGILARARSADLRAVTPDEASGDSATQPDIRQPD